MNVDQFEFLTLFTNYYCNYDCSYCSMRFVTNNKILLPKEKPLTALEFLQLNKIKHKLPDLPLHIHGGEPLVYPELGYLLHNLDFDLIIVVSNLSIPLPSCINNLSNLSGKVKFIGSFHPEYADKELFINNALLLKSYDMLNYVCGVDVAITDEFKALFLKHGLEFVSYPFRGIRNNSISPDDMKRHAKGWISGEPATSVLCKSSKFLIDPYGNIWNCSIHMYKNNLRYCYGNIKDGFDLKVDFYRCDLYNYCNPCQGPFHEYKEIIQA